MSNRLMINSLRLKYGVLTAWNYGAQDKLISDAAVFADKLFVCDCALNRYEIAFAQIRDLSAIPANKRTDFVISEDGSRISWPDHDIDINLDSIKTAINPHTSKAEAKEHDRIFGAAIAKLRKAHGIKQYEIPGLDERQVRRIESGQQHATPKSLQSLANAHGMELNDYLNTVAKYCFRAC